MRWPKLPKTVHPMSLRPKATKQAKAETAPQPPVLLTDFTYPKDASFDEVADLYFRHCELVADSSRKESKPGFMVDEQGDRCLHSFEYIDPHVSEVICRQCGLVLRKYYSEECLRVVKSVYIRRHRWNVRINQLQCCDAPPAPWLVERVIKMFKQLTCNTTRNRLAPASKTRIMTCLRMLKKQEPDVAKWRLISKSAEKWIHFKHIIDGTTPTKMCPELQQFLHDVFPGIERSFEEFKCILGRKSLIHYNFCLTRAIQEFIGRNKHNLDEETLKECESFLPLLPMLKSRPKVKNNDVIWDSMRQWLKWKEQELPLSKIYRGFK
jgi:Poxvirus Late Transcription Factor VLTF3 like